MDSSLHITYTGHATVLIEMDGVRLLADPILRHHLGPLRRRQGAPATKGWRVDAVLISHLHLDHFDVPSLRILGPNTRIILPRGGADSLNRLGFNRVEEIEAGETTMVGVLEVEATPAVHSNSRYPAQMGPTAKSIGFIIRGGSQVYFAGDTDIFPEMEAIGQELDVALLPVWGWGPRLGNGHMTPLRAAESLTLLRPRTAIPIHWGTFCPLGTGWMEFLSRPPREFSGHAATLAPGVAVHILEPGQSCYPNVNS